MVVSVDVTGRLWPLSWFDARRLAPYYGKSRNVILAQVAEYARTLGEEVSTVSDRDPVRGRALLYGGHAVGWMGFGLWAYGLFGQVDTDLLHLMMGPFGAGVAAQLVAAPMVRHGHKLLAPSAAELLAADKRRPILLLRSFRDDDAEIVGRVNAQGNASTAGLEETIGPPFVHFGPFIAIGKPGEALPRLGAAREQFGDADWQGAIARWMDMSMMLLVVPGVTRGLGWELDTIVKRRHAHKMLVLMPPPSGFWPWQARSSWWVGQSASGGLDFEWKFGQTPKAGGGRHWHWDSKLWKFRDSRVAAAEAEAARQERWSHVREAFRAVPGFETLPDTAPVGLIGIHLSTAGEPVLITGPEVPLADDYIRAIAFAVYGMKVHGKW